MALPLVHHTLGDIKTAHSCNMQKSIYYDFSSSYSYWFSCFFSCPLPSWMIIIIWLKRDYKHYMQINITIHKIKIYSCETPNRFRAARILACSTSGRTQTYKIHIFQLSEVMLTVVVSIGRHSPVQKGWYHILDSEEGCSDPGGKSTLGSVSMNLTTLFASTLMKRLL